MLYHLQGERRDEGNPFVMVDAARIRCREISPRRQRRLICLLVNYFDDQDKSIADTIVQ
jgi:hypothetical protein